MSDHDIVIFVGVYSSKDDAELDYGALLELHDEHLVGSYDAAVVSKDDNGKVHLRKHEKPTQHGAWSGLAIGALVGVVFPPSILATGAIGAAAGGLVGHFSRGMSRGDMKELGEMLDDGEAALVILAQSKIDEEVAKSLKRASRTYEKQVDAAAKEFRQELDQAIDDSTSASV